MPMQQAVKQLHPDYTVTWRDRQYGVSDPTDPKEVADFWLTEVPTREGITARLIIVSLEARDLGIHLWNELPEDKVKEMPYIEVTGDSR